MEIAMLGLACAAAILVTVAIVYKLIDNKKKED